MQNILKVMNIYKFLSCYCFYSQLMSNFKVPISKKTVIADSPLSSYLDMARYKSCLPGIHNIYYQTNLLQIIDTLPEQQKREVDQQIQKSNYNQYVLFESEKNQMSLIHNQTKENISMLSNIVMSHKHQYDQLGNDTIINQYSISKNILGKGSHSFVKLAKKEGKSFAIKIIAYDRLKKRIIIKDQNISKMINFQISMLLKLKSPYIIGFQQAIYVAEKQRVFIVLEYCSKGTILKFINSIPYTPLTQWQHKAKKYMYQIALGIHKMHENLIIHRDIKSENVLVNEKDEIKIIDFNVSCEIPENGLITISDKFIGTKTYAPPQLVIPSSVPREVDGRLIDIWALGITFLQFLQRRHPFNVQTPIQLVKMLQKPVTINKDFHPSLKDLLEKMLKQQNRQRIQIKEVLKHPWFKN